MRNYKQLLIGLVVVAILGQTTYGEEHRRILPIQVIPSLEWEDVTLVDCVQRLARRYNLPITFELASGDTFDTLALPVRTPSATTDRDVREDFVHSNMKRFSLSGKDVSLVEVVELMLEKNATYKWQISRGVVNILPKLTRTPFMERVVDEFSRTNESLLRVVSDLGLALPRRSEVSNDFEFEKWSWYTSPETIIISIDMKKATVRDILSEIVYQSGATFMTFAREFVQGAAEEYNRSPERQWQVQFGVRSRAKSKTTKDLIKGLSSKSSVIVKDCVIELRSRLTKIEDELIELCLKVEEITLRERILFVLAAGQSRKTLELLQTLSESDDKKTVAAVAGALQTFGPGGRELAQKLAGSSDRLVKGRAEIALRLYQNKRGN